MIIIVLMTMKLFLRVAAAFSGLVLHMTGVQGSRLRVQGFRNGGFAVLQRDLGADKSILSNEVYRGLESWNGRACSVGSSQKSRCPELGPTSY